jgi:hypothetical protein
MIRRYETILINLTKVPLVRLDNKSLIFNMQTNKGIMGNFLFFLGQDNEQRVIFSSHEEAKKEFNDISQSLVHYYKK